MSSDSLRSGDGGCEGMRGRPYADRGIPTPALKQRSGPTLSLIATQRYTIPSDFVVFWYAALNHPDDLIAALHYVFSFPGLERRVERLKYSGYDGSW